jgi:hypothetical protein
MRDVIAVHVGLARAMQWAETAIQVCMTIRVTNIQYNYMLARARYLYTMYDCADSNVHMYDIRPLVNILFRITCN